MLNPMDSPLFTLVADAYPLIWPASSVATVFPADGIFQPVEPGRAFSVTVGFDPVTPRAVGTPSTDPSSTVATSAAKTAAVHRLFHAPRDCAVRSVTPLAAARTTSARTATPTSRQAHL